LPILNYLKTEELRNVLVTVTRYYGGIKLGKGGLIRAYSGSARETINNNIIVTKKIVVETHIIISYNLYGGVENLLQNENLIVKDKNFEKDVTIKIIVLEEDIKKIKEKLINYTSDNIEFQDKEKKFMSVHNNKIII
jgi:putative IMPACT (imprinted ancient) family translation regulator